MNVHDALGAIKRQLDKLVEAAERGEREAWARFDALKVEHAAVEAQLHNANVCLYHISKHLPAHVPICTSIAEADRLDIDLADEVRNALADAHRNTQERPEAPLAQADGGDGHAKEAEVSGDVSRGEPTGTTCLTPSTTEPAKLGDDGASSIVGAISDVLDEDDGQLPF